MKQNTQNTQNTQETTALTMFDTNAISAGLDVANKTFRGLPISEKLAKCCTAYLSAELQERQAKIKKGIALFTIKRNALACIYTTDENGKPYAKDKSGQFTQGAKDKQFNRFMKEIGIPTSTYNRLISAAEYCSREKADAKTGFITLERINGIEKLPESVIMYAHSKHYPRNILESFITDSTDLTFKTADDFENAYQAFIKRTAQAQGISTQEGTQGAQEGTQEGAQESTQEGAQGAQEGTQGAQEGAQESDVPVSILPTKPDFAYIPFMSICGPHYLPVNLDLLNNYNNSDFEVIEDARKAIEESIYETMPLVMDSPQVMFFEINGGYGVTLSYTRRNSAGKYVYTCVDTFTYTPNADEFSVNKAVKH